MVSVTVLIAGLIYTKNKQESKKKSSTNTQENNFLRVFYVKFKLPAELSLDCKEFL